MLKHVMVDLETLATTADAVIVSIGAVKFDAKKIDTAGFYTAVSLQSNLELGRRISGQTLGWWMKQTDEARDVFNQPSLSLEAALGDFSDWLGRKSDFIVWSNGASFDIPILEHAYHQLGADAPWKFWNSRCFRTIKTMFNDVSAPDNPGAHNALADAYTQAQHLQLIWNKHDAAKKLA